MNQPKASLPGLENLFVSSLPADPDTTNQTRQVSGSCYSLVKPVGFPNARLLAWSEEMATELGISPDSIGQAQFTDYFSGTKALPDMDSYACCYGGHQFGRWAGQLGDGRAINIGEVRTASGQHQMLQLKGAGPTPYSRSADGLAVLRSSLREFVCSEAMYHLGVPTTRALSLSLSGESVVRDMFYDGRPALEPGAVVCRVAPSFVRFGSLEIFTARKETEVMKQLLDFTITRDFPHLGEPGTDTYLAWFNEVCQRTATLIVHWMRIGFVHGVMNTDNMSVLGLTIDYGPYGWLENYDPHWTPNTTDAEGKRYRFGQQPQIALWNLVQLANAIYPLIEDVEPLEQALEAYKTAYEEQWLQMMRNKLGLQLQDDGDKALADDLLDSFRHCETDMTIFFRKLAELKTADLSGLQSELEPEQPAIPEVLQHAWYEESPSTEAQQALLDWLSRYADRLALETLSDVERKTQMNQVNPLYVLRNWIAQLAIDDIENDGSTERLQELLQVLKTPYTEQTGKAHLAAKRPDWARERAGCSILSCSS